MYEVATISKPHGIHGEVVVKTIDNNPLDISKVYYLKNERGDLTPLRVEKQKVSQKGNETLFFVLFTGITNRQFADNLKGETLYSPDPLLVEIDIDETDPVFDTIGFEIVDTEGNNWGFVIDITETPAHAVFIINLNDKQYLLPVVDEHIETIDFDKEVIVAFNPMEFAEL